MTSSMFSGGGYMIYAISTGMLVLLLQWSTEAHAASPIPGESITAELFHREHSVFRSRSRLLSKTTVGHAERVRNDRKWSAARAQALISRRRGLTSAPPPPQADTFEANVTNEAPAEYLMQIALGTPAQNFLAVADTGSDLTWLQCAPCEACFNQTTPVFDPSLSTTYRPLPCPSPACQSFLELYGPQVVTSCELDIQNVSCGYSYYYGDESNTTGAFSAETINLKSANGSLLRVPEFSFGCSHSSFSPSSLFDAANGLIGLGQGEISFPSQLGDIFDDKFAYCLVNRSLSSVQSSLLVFGRDAVLGKSLQYTPFLNNSAFPYYYYVGIEGIAVDDVRVDYNISDLQLDDAGNGGTIIDSGTTFSYIDERAFLPLIDLIDAQIGGRYNRVMLEDDLAYLELCYDVTEHEQYESDFPVLGLELQNGTRWDLAADNVWILVQDVPVEGTNVACLAIMRGYKGGISIIGNTQQQDFYVLYDRVDQRLGFAPADCSAMATSR